MAQVNTQANARVDERMNAQASARAAAHLLSIEGIDVAYGDNVAVHDFSLTLDAGEICVIVGESGCGKTTVLRAVMGLLAGDGAVVKGDVEFSGSSLLNKTPRQWRRLRGEDIAMIFQDCGAMTNPTRRVGAEFSAYVRAHKRVSRAEAWRVGVDMLEKMQLACADEIMRSYPFQLSGGMRQRVGIAMACTFQPRLLLADEPTSALDVTTQAQIVRQLMELRDATGTGLLIVTHNLGVAAYMADKLVVMSEGRVVDAGDRAYILHESENEHTRRLMDAVPALGGGRFVR